MKKDVKKITAGCLTGIMMAVSLAPAVAQEYTNPYAGNYNNSYNTNYSQQQPAQYQQPYQTVPNYSQAQSYSQNYNNNVVPVQNNYSMPALQGSVVTVPAGTMIKGAAAATNIDSGRLTVGDTVTVYMAQPFYYAGNLVLPAGTNIQGNVVVSEKAGRTGKNGQLKVVFNNAVTPSGQRININGKFATEDGSGILKGGTGKTRATKAVKEAAVGAGAGALLGTIFGAVSGGKVGKGAAIGSAIGGGTGLAKTVIDKGNDVLIEAGEAIGIILDYPFTTGGAPATYQQEQALPSYNNYNY